MTPKERVLRAIACQETDRVPWVPFVGCHGAALLGIDAETYFKSADHIAQAAQLAVKKYDPDGLPVTFDLQIEAQALGCDLRYSSDNPPAVSSHPLTGKKQLSDLAVPARDQHRINTVLQAARQIRQNNPDIALYATITGPFTLALHLQGTDIFMKMFEDTDYVRQLMSFCKDTAKAMAEYYIEAGCDVIAVVDPMTSQIGPDQFNEFVADSATELFSHIRDLDAASSFFVCGHAQQNIASMCRCRPDNVSIDENIPLDYVRDECLKHNISFGGNLQLTTVLLLGSELDAQKDAIRCLDTAGSKGFILAPGCDLPYATPPENLQAVTSVVQDQYQRQIARNISPESVAEDELELPEYGKMDKVVIDLITLDSEACAPCQYMVDAIRQVEPYFDGKMQWHEHKIKLPAGLKMMTALMVRNIPTMCIDGEIVFVSRIPRKDEIIQAIEKRLKAKAAAQRS